MGLSSLHLDAFYALARAGSFSGAAKSLHVTQSALSQRILNLESELNMTLLLREPRGIRLTDAGETLLRYCQARDGLESELLHSLNAKGGTLSGRVRVGGFSTVLRSVVMPALSELVAEHAELHVDLFSREMRDLPLLLRTGEADAIVTDHALPQTGMVSIPLGEEENVLVEPTKKKAPWGVFLDHDADDPTTEAFFRLQKTRPSEFRRRFLDEIYAILDGVERGWGQAVVPRHLAESRTGLRVIKGLKPLRVPIFLNYASQAFYPAVFTKVMERLTKRAREILS